MLLKLHFCDQPWRIEWHLKAYGSPGEVKAQFYNVIANTDDNAARLMAKYTLVELDALLDDHEAIKTSLHSLASDSLWP